MNPGVKSDAQDLIEATPPLRTRKHPGANWGLRDPWAPFQGRCPTRTSAARAQAGGLAQPALRTGVAGFEGQDGLELGLRFVRAA